MKVHKLELNVIAKIKSSVTINSIPQCITELVLNSLDAKSTAIAVRINFVTFRIQVVDNGEGISKDNLGLIGQRYMTNKCNNLDQLESQCSYYGFRGEALASIFNIAERVEIVSKHVSSGTYSRSFGKGRGETILVRNRPSLGTTVTIEGFLHNLPLRRKRVVSEMEIVHIKRNVESLIIIHPNVSFSLRNDVTGDLILNSRKCVDVTSSLKSLYPEINGEPTLIKVSKNNITVKGFLFKELYENNHRQYIYVNKRPIKFSKIQMFIYNIIQRNKKYAKNASRLGQLCVNDKNKHPIYVINIQCPCSFVDLLLCPTKTVVEFQNWDIIFSCIEKLMFSFLGNNDKTTKQKYANIRKPVKNDCGVSQINGVCKSYGFKRKTNSNNGKPVSEKKQKFRNTIDSENLGLLTELPQLPSFKDTSYDDFIELESDKAARKKQSCAQSQYRKRKPLKNTNNISEFPSAYNAENTSTGNIVETENEENAFIDSGKQNHIEKVVPTIPFRHMSHKIIHPLPVRISKNINTIKDRNLDRNDVSREEFKFPKINKIDSNVVCKSVITPNEFSLNKVPTQESFLSKFTNDENKGKSLIMDMFLKSTQVYNSGDEDQDSNSENTVVEIESKYLLENNITTNVNGKTKTMSVSVNITKKIKKRQRKERPNTTSKLIQTSLDKGKMISKCIQTSMYQENDKGHCNFNNYSTDTKFAENCTLIFSSAFCQEPHFKFIYRTPIKPYNHLEIPKCNNHYNNYQANFKKFNFNLHKNKNAKSTQNNIGYKHNFNSYEISLSPIKRLKVNQNRRFEKNIKTHRRIEENYLKNYDRTLNYFPNNMQQFENNKKYITSMGINYPHPVRSPYFYNCRSNSKPQLKTAHTIHPSIQKTFGLENNVFFGKVRPDQSYSFFKPQYHGTQVNHLCDNQCCTKKFEFGNTEPITTEYFSQKFKPIRSLSSNINSQFNVSTMSNFTERSRDSTKKTHGTNEIHEHSLCNNIINQSNAHPTDISGKNITDNMSEFKFRKNCFNDICNTTLHDNPKVKSTSEHQANETGSELNFTKLLITLSNRQRQEILENELNMNKSLCNKMNLDWESQIAVTKDKKEPESEQFGQEWMRKLNNFGSSFYINKRTGFATFCTPKPKTNEFKLCRRLEFIPKGLSPILKEVKEVDKSLSQNKKDKLESYILESHQDELLVVKWQNYIKNNDPKTFFDEVYREKLNLLENCIPRALQSKKSYPISFDKALFDDIVVIGQVDKKFIAVIENTKQLLLLFDQHAVHERIRLEELLKGYSNTTVPSYGDELIVILPKNDLSLLKKHENYLNSLGLSLQFFKDGINVVEIPSCLYSKFKKDVCNSLNAVMQLLIKEIIDLIKETGGVTFKNLPKMIQNVINLEACRGAIKFGDKLSNNDCHQLLKKLSICNLPFQCAHGRPTLVPLISLNLTRLTVSKSKLNFKKLFQMYRNM